MTNSRQPVNGYSLVELLVATVLFTIIAGTIFSLLFSAQLRYQGESGVTTAFQQANIAIDQITRDVHSAGYPPPSSFAASPLQGTTLMRGVTQKTAFSAFADPVASTAGSLLPYLENLQNGQGNNSTAIFSYGPLPLSQPSNIRTVNVVLIVQAAQPDPQTGQFRTISLTGQAALFN